MVMQDNLLPLLLRATHIFSLSFCYSERGKLWAFGAAAHLSVTSKAKPNQTGFFLRTQLFSLQWDHFFHSFLGDGKSCCAYLHISRADALLRLSHRICKWPAELFILAVNASKNGGAACHILSPTC